MPRWIILLIRPETANNCLTLPCQCKQTYQRGFTLIELIVSLVVISLIAMIAMPNYFAMQERGRQAMVLENKRMVQQALETFASDFNGYYPQGVENALPGGGFAYYFPGGDEDLQTKCGRYPTNPYTGCPMTAAGFLVYVYACSGDNRDPAIAGPNDWRAPAPGMIRYGQYPLCQPPLRSPFEYGVVGARRDLLSLRFSRIIVLHN